MKGFFAVAFIALLATAQASTSALVARSVGGLARPQDIVPPKGDWCEACVIFMNSQIEELEQIIANIGISDGCAVLCGNLASPLLAEVCTVLCEVEGIQAFVNYVQEIDPDPIFICMELKQCPIVDTAAGRITTLTVNPTTAKHGDTVNINWVFQITNATGVGEVAFAVVPPQSDGGSGTGGANLFDSLPVGSYSMQFQVPLKGGGQQEPWSAGTYQVQAAICEGSCGSIHPHSYTMDLKQTSFKIIS